MRVEKLSVSLSPDAIRLIDAYRGAHAIKSRSQVIEQALRRLQDEELESAYRAAAAEGTAEWEVTSSDGLQHETW